MASPIPVPADQYKSKKKRPESTIIKESNEPCGYPLPEGMMTDRQGNPIQWHPATQLWWEEWRTSPQATRMLTGPDWSYLLDTALMHHAMWTYKKWELAGEVRMRVSKFGATPDDRARLRLEIQTNEEAHVGNESASNVTSISSRKARLRDA